MWMWLLSPVVMIPLLDEVQMNIQLSHIYATEDVLGVTEMTKSSQLFLFAP